MPDILPDTLCVSPNLDAAATRYVRRIRNSNKRRYAEEYAAYLTGACHVPPQRNGLGMMAVQAVEHELLRLLPRMAAERHASGCSC